MRVAIHQPNFLPWMGYFDKMRSVDTFVLLDNVQYPKGTVINRIKIRTKDGSQYITVPVRRTGHLRRIFETEIANEMDWRSKMLNVIECNYRKSKNFSIYFEFLRNIFYEKDWKFLSELNVRLINGIVNILKIPTKLLVASELSGLDSSLKASDMLVDITSNVGCNTYYSGAGSSQYLQADRFLSAGIRLEFQKFIHQEYPQTFPGFVKGLSIIDYLMNVGDVL